MDLWTPDSVPCMHVTGKNGQETDVETLDLLATTWSDRPGTALAAVNKHPSDSAAIRLSTAFEAMNVVIYRLNGSSPDSYNDVDRTEVSIRKEELGMFRENMEISVEPHSVNVIQLVP